MYIRIHTRSVTRMHTGTQFPTTTHIIRVGQNHIYTVCIRYFWQGIHHIYGHIRCIYTVLANPTHNQWLTHGTDRYQPAHSCQRACGGTMEVTQWRCLRACMCDYACVSMHTTLYVIIWACYCTAAALVMIVPTPKTATVYIWARQYAAAALVMRVTSVPTKTSTQNAQHGRIRARKKRSTFRSNSHEAIPQQTHFFL